MKDEQRPSRRDHEQGSAHRSATGPDPAPDVDAELAFHIEMRERELIARGESPERARELALQRFGNYATSREECVAIDERQVRRYTRRTIVGELRQDLGYALRMLARTPSFTVIAVLTLALGIGANSAIFSVVNAVLLESLPYRAAHELYEVRTVYPDGTGYPLSAPDFMSVRADSRVFDGVVGYAGGMVTLLSAGEPREIRAAQLSDGFLDLMGVRLAFGRGFVAEEHVPGSSPVALLDHGFWQREFGGARDVIGRTLEIQGRSWEVIGVLAEGAGVPERADVYAALPQGETFDAATATARRSEFLRVIGRARSGLTFAQVEADLRGIGADLADRFPQTNARQTFGAVSLRETILGDVRTPLLVLLGAVGFVLLVACANVANLMLARASARQGELAVRAALGAGRGRLVRQLLTEATVLGILGGAFGLLLAWIGTKALVNAQPADIPRLDQVGIDGTVLLVTLALSLLTGLAFGAAPALQATRTRLTHALRAESRGMIGGAGQRLRSMLIVAEIAVAVVLLVGAGLLLRSFVELTRVNPGFQPERAVAFRIAMGPATYPEGQQIRDFVDGLTERLGAMPGVTAVGAASTLPLSGISSLIDFAVDGAPPPPDDVNAEISIVSVTPDYHAAIGARIVRGRPLDERDGAAEPLVALINEAGARQWFPGEDPVGRRVVAGQPREIVGVVSDVLQRDPGSPAAPELYVPHRQRTTRALRMVVRTATDPLALAPAIRSELRALDATMPISDFTPLGDVISASVARPRFYTALLTLFAALALALAAIGIFGVMSYSVAQRAREIGIRMALGARGREVVSMVVGRSVLLAGVGLVIGGAVALALSRVLRSQLYNVGPTDPVTFAAVSLVLLAAAGLAALLPARRAAAVDPGHTLRGG